MISRNERSVIHTVILTMSSGEPPAAAITRRTFSNISRHCSSRSAGTLPVSGSVPEIAPDTTKGPRRLALGIGLTCFAPATSMLRRFFMLFSHTNFETIGSRLQVMQDRRMLSEYEQRFLVSRRVGHLATADARANPHL